MKKIIILILFISIGTVNGKGRKLFQYILKGKKEITKKTSYII